MIKVFRALIICLLPILAIGQTSPTFSNPQNSHELTQEQITRIEREFGIDLSDIQYVSAPDNPEIYAVRDNFEASNDDLIKVSRNIDKSLARLVDAACKMLAAKGYKKDAKKLKEEYEASFQNAAYLYYLNVQNTGIGDHRPLSEWLATWYDKLEARLGKFIMEITRLKDIKIFNYCLVVCLNPKGDPKISPITPWGQDEYTVHFVPLMGAISYWLSWGACVGATWGMGAIAFVCSSVSWGIEYMVMTYVAPDLSVRIYERYN